MRKFALSVLAFVLLVACGHRGPSRPQLIGPASGRPGDSLSYAVQSTDPDGKDVAYSFDWDDGTVMLEYWTPYYASGQAVSQVHVYSDTGHFAIRVNARNRDSVESGWCDPQVVVISQSPPEKPITPVGPAYCTTSVSYTYKVIATHPQGAPLQFQFDWSGAVSNWGSSVASGETAEVSHVFDTAGTYTVAARARDNAGLLSDWSDPLSVMVVDIPGGRAWNLSLAAATDTTVQLTWSAPTEGVPSLYRVMFRPVGGTYNLVLETADTSCEHDPGGLTGEYRVLARFGGAYFEPEDTLSTVPVPTNSTWVDELNGSGKPGHGWPAPGRTGVTYDMSDTAWVDQVEFYITDFKAGSGGPTYYVASPDLAPGDSGGGVPAGRWHVTSFAELTSEQGPVPPSGDSAWRTSARVPDAPTCTACRTQQGYYAIVKVTQVRIAQADVRLETWFQPVQGLRLLRH
jgi:hypothetical protein